MTTRPRSRAFLVGAAAAALLAPIALLSATQTSATAAAGKPHDVRMYKVEKYVAVDGEFPDNTATVDLSCNSGDYVTDGMWKIDSVDDDYDDWGDPVVGDARKIRFYWSYPSAPDKWSFKLVNNNLGRAQMKFWITCIGGKVDYQFGHEHFVTVQPRLDSPKNLVAASDNYFGAGAACPANTIPVAPGFYFGGTQTGVLNGSWPKQGNAGSWQWWFTLDGDAPGSVFTISCLDQYTSAYAGHRHKIQYRYTSDPFIGDTRNSPVSKKSEQQVSCDDRSKALVAGFFIYDPHYVWYLGMEPRIKTRVSFFRYDGVGDSRVSVIAMCFNDRTGRQIA